MISHEFHWIQTEVMDPIEAGYVQCIEQQKEGRVYFDRASIGVSCSSLKTNQKKKINKKIQSAVLE